MNLYNKYNTLPRFLYVKERKMREKKAKVFLLTLQNIFNFYNPYVEYSPTILLEGKLKTRDPTGPGLPGGGFYFCGGQPFILSRVV